MRVGEKKQKLQGKKICRFVSGCKLKKKDDIERGIAIG